MENNINTEGTQKEYVLWDLEINDNDNTEVEYLSLVLNPAVEDQFVAFNQQEKTSGIVLENFQFKTQDESKHIVTGIFMRAGKPIKRIDEDTNEEYFVRFSADNIERAVKKFFKNKFNANIDKEHNNELLKGCYIVDSWFIRDKDSNPLKAFGFTVNPGDWAGSVLIDNAEIWDEYVKTGKIRGFSVEGLFKFGKKKVITTGFTEVEEEDSFDFTEEELDVINKIADFLLDDE